MRVYLMGGDDKGFAMRRFRARQSMVVLPSACGLGNGVLEWNGTMGVGGGARGGIEIDVPLGLERPSVRQAMIVSPTGR